MKFAKQNDETKNNLYGLLFLWMIQMFVVILKLISSIPLGQSKNLHNFGTTLATQIGTASLNPFLQKVCEM